MDTISHTGIVKKIEGQAVQVLIQQASACDLCHAKSICSSADTKEKVVNVSAPQGSVSVGDTVLVQGAASMGMRAVFLAYVLPLILLVVVLVLFLTLIAPGREALAAIASLAVLAPYALVLYLRRDKMMKEFRFEIAKVLSTKLDDDELAGRE